MPIADHSDDHSSHVLRARFGFDGVGELRRMSAGLKDVPNNSCQYRRCWSFEERAGVKQPTTLRRSAEEVGESPRYSVSKS